MLGVEGHFEQGFGAGVKQELVDHFLVLQSQWRQFPRQSENDMHVRGGEQLGGAPAANGGGHCPGILDNGDCDTSCKRWRNVRSGNTGRDDRRARPCDIVRWPAALCGVARSSTGDCVRGRIAPRGEPGRPSPREAGSFRAFAAAGDSPFLTTTRARPRGWRWR